MSFQRIDVATAKQLIAERGAAVVDIRDPMSYERGHIENAIHVGDHNVQEFVQTADRNVPVIVCCFHGNSSQGAAAYFDEQGFVETFSLDGGYEAWRSASRP
jgi:thiosulfate sulfurtransferase